MFSWLPGFRQVGEVNYLTDLLVRHTDIIRNALRNTLNIDGVNTECDNIYVHVFVAVIVARIHLIFHGDKQRQEQINKAFLMNFAKDLSRQHKMTFEEVWKRIELTDSYVSRWV